MRKNKLLRFLMNHSIGGLHCAALRKLRLVYDESEAQAQSRLFMKAALGADTQTLLMEPEREVDDESAVKLFEMLARSIGREPSAYITGIKEFMSLDFIVDSSCLIPRPETEILVEAVIDYSLKSNKKKIRILDIGTGSGVIAVSLAVYLSNAFLTAVDISSKALKVAKANAVKHKAVERIEFIESNLYEALRGKNVFDIIVSNPPYIAYGDQIDQCVKDFEPENALWCGESGLELTEKILTGARDFLTDDGFLAIEIASQRSNETKALFDKNVYKNIKIIKDNSNLDRIITASV